MQDEHLYEQAALELAQQSPKPGVMAKAFSEAGGDVARAQALYIRLRVDQLKEAEREAAQRQK